MGGTGALSGAEAPLVLLAEFRGLKPPAPSGGSFPQGLKPGWILGIFGTTEVVPFYKSGL